ncbi:hypothetical protein BGX21_005910, partial [Mortierella sp. AD011]
MLEYSHPVADVEVTLTTIIYQERESDLFCIPGTFRDSSGNPMTVTPLTLRDRCKARRCMSM